MKLSSDEVRQIARLARLKLSDDETERYRDQLSHILEYVNQLSEVDTEGVPPTAQVTGQVNITAADEVGNEPQTKKLLAGAPAIDGSSIKVRAVFD